MRKFPVGTYNGLTLIMPALSRFDTANGELFVGPQRGYTQEVLNKWGYNVDDCDVQLAEKYKDLLPGTKYVILCGEASLNKFEKKYGLDAHAGFCQERAGIAWTYTYWPQDCVDLRNEEGGDEDEEADAGGNGKDSAPTSRANYRFWFESDVTKLLDEHFRTQTLPTHFVENRISPAQGEQILGKVSREDILYLDIETWMDTNCVSCLSFAISDGPVFTIVVYNYTHISHRTIPGFFAQLARAIGTCVVVCHNSLYDLCFLAAYHGIPFGRRNWDTMLVMHRLCLEVEKSLAHAIRRYANAPYHKGSYISYYPRNKAQMDSLCLYNARDVDTLRAVYREQRRIYDRDPSVRRSIDQANRLVYPYALMGLTGIGIDTDELTRIQGINEARLVQYQRIINILAGYELNPNSPTQLVKYFHDQKGYKVVERTDVGVPSVGADVLYSFIITYGNPIIKAILAARKMTKQLGMLKFKWFFLKRKRT